MLMALRVWQLFILSSVALADDDCTYESCPVCFPEYNLSRSNLTLIGPDGFTYQSPLRIGRASAFWDTQSMLGTTFGIIANELLGLEVQYTDCPDETTCHLGVLYCAEWSDGSCTPYKTKKEAEALVADNSKKWYPDPLPDIFVALEVWPKALEQSGLGVDPETWESRESVIVGPTGFFVEYSLFVFPDPVTKAWQERNASLDIYHLYNSSIPLEYLVSPRFFINKFKEENVVPPNFGCPGEEANFTDTAISGMEALRLLGYVCREAWWLSPTCAALGEGEDWKDQCVAAIDDDWGSFKTDVFYGISKTPMRLAKFVLGYDLFQPTMLTQGIENSTFFSWSTPDAGFVRKAPVTIVLPDGLGLNDLIISKVAWKQMLTVNTKLAALLKQFLVTNSIVATMMDKVIAGVKDGKGPTEAEQAGFMQKVACEWLRGNGNVWRPWLPSSSTCDVGSGFDESSGECRLCEPGTAVRRKAGLSICANCTTGRFTSERGATTCSECTVGFFTDAEGSTTCTPCPLGRFQNTSGQPFCKQCPSSFTTKLQGSDKHDDCKCPSNTFLRLEQGIRRCVDCPEGLFCPGSDVMPTQVPGYWAQLLDAETRVFSIYKCKNPKQCPEGSPGTCAVGRIARACHRCDRFYYETTGGECEPCTEGDKVPFSIVISLVCIVALSSNFIFSSDLSKQQLSQVTMTMLIGQAIAAVQVLQVIGRFAISWSDPAKYLISLISVLNFDFNLVRTSCVMGNTSPMVSMILLLCVYPFIMASLFTGFFISKLTSKPMTWQAFCNQSGTILLVLFISLTLAMLIPLQCVSNPNGKQTVSTYPGLICWDSSEPDQVILATLSIFGVVIYPTTFFALIIWATWKYPARMVSPKGLKENQKFTFVFGRFRAETYYFGVIYVTRSLLLALIPVIFSNEASLQIVAFAVAFLAGSTFQVLLWPWRTSLCNIADWTTSFFVALLLQAMGPLQDVKNMQVPGYIIFFILLMLFVTVFAIIGYVLYSKFRPPEHYGLFLCHHKAAAGSLCRFIKIIAKMHCKTKVFLDSDELENLDILFDTVRCLTTNLVVILTSELLSRPWCAGEIVTAFRNRVQMWPIVCDDFNSPSDADIKMIKSSWTAEQVNILNCYGIKLDMIDEAFSHLLELSSLFMGRQGAIDYQESIVVKLIISCGLSRRTNDEVQVRNKQGRFCITGDVSDPEALSSIYVTQLMLQEMLQEEVIILTTLDGAETAADVKTTIFLIVLLTRGLLEVQIFPEILITMVEDRDDLTSMVVLNADPAFQFPSNHYYEELEVQTLALPSLGQVNGARLCGVYRRLFAVIALPLSPLASARLLKRQISEVRERLNHHGLDLATEQSRYSM